MHFGLPTVHCNLLPLSSRELLPDPSSDIVLKKDCNLLWLLDRPFYLPSMLSRFTFPITKHNFSNVLCCFLADRPQAHHIAMKSRWLEFVLGHDQPLPTGIAGPQHSQYFPSFTFLVHYRPYYYKWAQHSTRASPCISCGVHWRHHWILLKFKMIFLHLLLCRLHSLKLHSQPQRKKLLGDAVITSPSCIFPVDHELIIFKYSVFLGWKFWASHLILIVESIWSCRDISFQPRKKP